MSHAFNLLDIINRAEAESKKPEVEEDEWGSISFTDSEGRSFSEGRYAYDKNVEAGYIDKDLNFTAEGKKAFLKERTDVARWWALLVIESNIDNPSIIKECVNLCGLHNLRGTITDKEWEQIRKIFKENRS